MVNNDLKRII